ncbi:hypothetical protein [Membranihabitans marinus]|uniref:hypothetical protein n=1 Tax=Membranihabitans marinus TaxID=1227546 RepID=UPI001F1FDEC0|nr:hypothetical protein [Membranihabitans marinus]
MLNDYNFIIILILGLLTSCKHSVNPVESGDKTSKLDELPPTIYLEDSVFSDSMQLMFLVENPAGSYRYRKYDFQTSAWYAVDKLMERKFLPGPLHSGKVVYRREEKNIVGNYFLMSKDKRPGDVVAVMPLAQLQINNKESIVIFKPVDESDQLDHCMDFDEWFTICDEYRYFIQYWLERQYNIRSIERIQWLPINTSDFITSNL